MKNDDKTIEQLREELARQVLQLALKEDNPQFKLDAYKATQTRADRGKQAEVSPADSMSIFQQRVQKAANVKADGSDE